MPSEDALWLCRSDAGAHQERCCSHLDGLLCPDNVVRSLAQRGAGLLLR